MYIMYISRRGPSCIFFIHWRGSDANPRYTLTRHGTCCWWKKSGVYQLRLVVYPIIYRVLCIPNGAGFPPSTVGIEKGRTRKHCKTMTPSSVSVRTHHTLRAGPVRSLRNICATKKQFVFLNVLFGIPDWTYLRWNCVIIALLFALPSSHSIHAWYIYLHLPYKSSKCR